VKGLGLATRVSYEPFELETAVEDDVVTTTPHLERKGRYATVVSREGGAVAVAETGSMRAAREAHVRAVMELMLPTSFGWSVVQERPAPTVAEVLRDLDGALADATAVRHAAARELAGVRRVVERNRRAREAARLRCTSTVADWP